MKIDFRQVYIDRLFEIENQIRKMRKTNNWTNYGKLKEEKLKICPEENSKVDWLSPDEAVRSSTEAWMKPIYKKLNQKMRKYLG